VSQKIIQPERRKLVMALQHFNFNLTPAQFPVQVYTDHNPLVFLNKMKNKNQYLNFGMELGVAGI